MPNAGFLHPELEFKSSWLSLLFHMNCFLNHLPKILLKKKETKPNHPPSLLLLWYLWKKSCKNTLCRAYEREMVLIFNHNILLAWNLSSLLEVLYKERESVTPMLALFGISSTFSIITNVFDTLRKEFIGTTCSVKLWIFWLVLYPNSVLFACFFHAHNIPFNFLCHYILCFPQWRRLSLPLFITAVSKTC